MKLLELVTELEIDSPAANIGSPLRSVVIGNYLDLKADNRVVDFGCGRGEMLCLWARCFAITGIGVDRNQPSLADAASRAAQWGIADCVQFRCQDMKEFDAADCAYDRLVGKTGVLDQVAQEAAASGDRKDESGLIARQCDASAFTFESLTTFLIIRAREKELTASDVYDRVQDVCDELRMELQKLDREIAQRPDVQQEAG